ncbi:hypothetical protein LWC35_25660 [Pseudonocardia kujensis]|uniref:hypothetical protein n=1 Tax=Pseudonocardia kujensis TaxID=1128675 RepID=UPI001E455511|nr:hypothetical protein [Pseudonocardia kujensis]MCE0766264.1 hypothetical protein [Pseudonocardia kujensis]
MSLDENRARPLSPAELQILAGLERDLDTGLDTGADPGPPRAGTGAPAGIRRAAVALGLLVACAFVGVAAEFGGPVLLAEVAGALGLQAALLCWLVHRRH